MATADVGHRAAWRPSRRRSRRTPGRGVSSSSTRREVAGGVRRRARWRRSGSRPGCRRRAGRRPGSRSSSRRPPTARVARVDVAVVGGQEERRAVLGGVVDHRAGAHPGAVDGVDRRPHGSRRASRRPPGRRRRCCRSPTSRRAGRGSRGRRWPSTRSKSSRRSAGRVRVAVEGVAGHDLRPELAVRGVVRGGERVLADLEAAAPGQAEAREAQVQRRAARDTRPPVASGRCRRAGPPRRRCAAASTATVGGQGETVGFAGAFAARRRPAATAALSTGGSTRRSAAAAGAAARRASRSSRKRIMGTSQAEGPRQDTVRAATARVDRTSILFSPAAGAGDGRSRTRADSCPHDVRCFSPDSDDLPRRLPGRRGRISVDAPKKNRDGRAR